MLVAVMNANAAWNRFRLCLLYFYKLYTCSKNYLKPHELTTYNYLKYIKNGFLGNPCGQTIHRKTNTEKVWNIFMIAL